MSETKRERGRSAMKQATKKEILEVQADHDYWRQLEKYLPWNLYGFTFRKHATYFTNQRDLLTITGEQRDQIVTALTKQLGDKP